MREHIEIEKNNLLDCKLKINLILYSNDKYMQIAHNNIEKYKEHFENVYLYTDKDISNTDFYKNNIDILTCERGGGYWLWKPYILLDQCYKNPNQIFLYMDCGDEIDITKIPNLLEILGESSLCLAQSYHSHSAFTKRDCFYYMGCDDPQYWNSYQIEAGNILFKSDNYSIKIFKEWLEWCQDPRILTDEPNQCEYQNHPNFIQHRWDQSVLTNLKIKYNIYSTFDFTSSFNHNRFIP